MNASRPARLLLVLCTLASLPAAAGPGHPSAQPGWELPLPLAAPGAWSRGEWRAVATGTQLAVTTHGTCYLVPNVDAGKVQHGMVRARLRTQGGKHDFTLLYAFRPGPHPEAFSAYGVSVEPGQVLLHRFDAGLVSELGPRAALPKLSEHPSLELVLFRVGPYVSAILYDAETLEPLASLTHAEPSAPVGHVGLRVENKAAPHTVVESLSVLSPVVPEADAGPLPSGTERKVSVPRSALSSVPEPLRATALERLPGEDPALATLLLPGPEAVERLRRAGVQPTKEHETYAWLDLDPDYRHAVATGTPPKANGYMDAEMVEARLRALQAAHPDISRLVSLGKTHQGRDIWALRVTHDPGASASRPSVLVNGAHHGDELLSTAAVLDAIARLLESSRSKRSQALLRGLELWFVPLVNPDGNMRFMRTSLNAGRKNGRDLDGDGKWNRGEGVDLNRNYPFQWGALGEVGSRSWPQHHRYRGPSEGSEPETQALVQLARTERFVASLSWHTASTAVLPPYTVESVRPPEPNVGRLLAEELVKGGPAQDSGRPYKVLPRLYAVDGTDQDWHAWAHGTAALLVEGPLHNPRDAAAAGRAVSKGRFLLDRFLDRVLAGPRLSLEVVDEAGHPLSALVTVKGLATFAGERWSSRPRDGRFELLLEGPAPRTVDVAADGFAAAQVTATPGKLTRVVLHRAAP